MLFNSIQFVFFLPLVILLFYVLPHRFRWLLLLLASYFFYMFWKVEYALLMFSTTVLNYFTALEMEKQVLKKDRKFILIFSLLFNLGLLVFFKYFNFTSQFLTNITGLLDINLNFPLLDLLLPLGISFYIFQMLSYTVEVYHGRQEAEHHFGFFALYVSFFPQLLIGPIERYQNLGLQLQQRMKFDNSNLVNGFRLILYGLFIKMVIADNLAFYVNRVYEAPGTFSSFDIFISWVFYSFQIYADLHGYTLIALGSALLIGIQLSENFKSPYLSRSITEFWQRWHISLSYWFRDYLYLPLGGNKRGRIQWIFNVALVFMVFALWHGPRLTYIIWGGIFTLFILLEYFVFNGKVGKVNRPFKPFHLSKVFLIFILLTFAWIFFRSESVLDAFQMMHYAMTDHSVSDQLNVKAIVWALLSLFILSDVYLYNTRYDKALEKLPWPLRWLNYAFLIFAIISFSAVDHIPFIYFQF
jgi:alginate O-acetyltransferase complex protein AlgI